MTIAISFARLYEEKIYMENRRVRSLNKQMTSKSTTSTIPNQNPNTIKLTQEELKERSIKGLC